MAKKTKSSSDRKKGPKGKKARAKAKLERNWGETVVDHDAGLRQGKSRILSKKRDSNPEKSEIETGPAPKFLQSSHENRKIDSDDSENSDSDSHDFEEMDHVGGTYSELLRTIRKNSTEETDVDNLETDGNKIDHEDSDSSDHSREMKPEVSPGSSSEESEEEKETTHDIKENMDSFDPFGQRFSNISPLPEDQAKKEEKLTGNLEIVKVAVPQVDPLLEIQVSKPLCEAINLEKDATKTYWKRLAKSSFRCNRDFLTSRWTEVNACSKKLRGNWLFSPLQSVLYPFITRYADCLLTCKSREVRILSYSSLLKLYNAMMLQLTTNRIAGT
jgi:hypothetical protein